MGHPAALSDHADLLHDLDGERLDRTPLLSPSYWRTSCEVRGRPSGAATISRQSSPDYGPGPSWDIHAIVEEAMRLGCRDAPEW